MANELDRLEVKRLAEPKLPEWVAFIRSIIANGTREADDIKAALDGLDDETRTLIYRYLLESAEHHERDRELLAPLRCYSRIIFGGGDRVFFYRGSPLAD